MGALSLALPLAAVEGSKGKLWAGVSNIRTSLTRGPCKADGHDRTAPEQPGARTVPFNSGSQVRVKHPGIGHYMELVKREASLELKGVWYGFAHRQVASTLHLMCELPLLDLRTTGFHEKKRVQPSSILKSKSLL